MESKTKRLDQMRHVLRLKHMRISTEEAMCRRGHAHVLVSQCSR
jgi:hypothetical protein